MAATTAYDVLCQAAERWPDKTAVVEDGLALTFGELHERTLVCARAFVGAGFEHGDRFAIWAPNSINWQLTALAGQVVGCVLVPLNTRFRVGEAEDIIVRSGRRCTLLLQVLFGHRLCRHGRCHQCTAPKAADRYR